MNIIQRIAHQANLTPNAKALVYGTETVSFRQLVDLVNRAAAYLKPLQDHDIVAVDFKDGVNSIVARLACMQLGIVAAPISNRLPQEEIVKRWQLVEATHMITDEFHEQFAAFPQMCVADIIEASRALPPLQEYTPGGDVPLLITWSGGTSGTPDALLQTHTSILEQANNSVHYWGPATTNRVHYAPAPMTTSVFTYLLLICLVRGDTTLFDTAPFNPVAVANNIVNHKVEYFTATPPVYSLLLRKKLLSPESVPAINLIGGDVVSSQLVNEWESTYGGVLHTTLASSQTGVITLREKGDPINSIGRLFSCVEMKLLDENGKEVAPGQPGEAWFRSSQAAIADRTVDNSTSVKDGWITCRDILQQDQSGLLYFVGRSNDTFKINGLFVSPIKIEDQVRNVAGVEDAVVVYTPDEHGIKRVKVHVVAQPGVQDKELIAQNIRMLPNLAAHERPRHVAFIDAVPRHPGNMKVQRSQLRA